MAEIYFSVDIEADGPYPGDLSMSSLGAVACAVMENDGSLSMLDVDLWSNRFYRELQPVSDNFDEEAASISGLNRQDLIKYGRNPVDAMKEFNNFVRDVAFLHSATPVFVAWPAPYDWFWTYWYLMKFAGESAFGFSGVINMKDWYAAKAKIPSKKVGKRNVYSKLGIKARPHTHDALDDAVEQAELWQAILRMEK